MAVFFLVSKNITNIKMSKFLVNEPCILPSGVFISYNTPERYQKIVTEELDHISEYR